MPVTRADLVTVMAKASAGSKVSADRALEAFIGTVFESLRKRPRVTIGGFGTFMVTRRAARAGRDRRSGKVIAIPAKRAPRFKASRTLKAAIL